MNDQRIEATVVFCLVCGKAEMQFAEWRDGNTARLACKSCGSSVFVKNGLVNGLETDASSLEALSKTAMVPPKQNKCTKEQIDAAKANRPTKEKGWRTVSFRLTDGQHEVWLQARDACKAAHGFVGKLWQGTAFEAICADYLAGMQNSSIVPDIRKLTPEKMKKVTGKELRNLAVWVFMRGINKMFSGEDDIRKYVVENIPDEYKPNNNAEVENV